MKFCSKCGENINEDDKDEKWSMSITKKGQKIIEFEAFHINCWKQFFKEAVDIEMRERVKLNKS